MSDNMKDQPRGLLDSFLGVSTRDFSIRVFCEIEGINYSLEVRRFVRMAPFLDIYVKPVIFEGTE